MSENHRKTPGWSLSLGRRHDGITYRSVQYQHARPLHMSMTLVDNSTKDNKKGNDVRNAVPGRWSQNEPKDHTMLPSQTQTAVPSIVTNLRYDSFITTDRYAMGTAQRTAVNNTIPFTPGSSSTAPVGAFDRSITKKERRAMRRDQRRQSAAQRAAHRQPTGVEDMEPIRSVEENRAIEKRIRNRESVQRCRARKRRRTENLLSEAKELEGENEIMRALLSQLESLSSTQKAD